MIDYHITSEVWLSLEKFYNEGLSPEQAKEIIENLIDPGSYSLHLRCESSGLNHNWIVRTRLRRGTDIAELVSNIEWELTRELCMISQQNKEIDQ